MKEERKTRKQLLDESIEQRRLVSELKASMDKMQKATGDIEERGKEYQELADSIPLPVFEMDAADLYIRFANRSALDTFGYSPEDLDNGIPGLQVIIPEERERAGEAIRKRLTGELSGGVEFTGLRKDGSTFPVIIHSSPAYRDGKPVQIRGVVVDITERKRAEEALRSSEESIRALLNATGDLALLIDTRGKILAANEKAAGGFGTTPEELLGTFVSDYTTPPEIARLRQKRINEVRHSKKPIHVEDRIGGKILQGTAYPVLDDKGEVERVAVFARDITEQKLAQEAIRESEEKYRVLFETAKDAIFLNDDTGRFVDVNQAACDSLGYTKEELCRLSNKIIDAEPGGFEAFKKIRDGTAKEVIFEVNQRRKDGTLLPVEITGSSFTIGGRWTGLAIARDITERKQAEDALRRVKEDLEKQNIELKRLDKIKDGLLRDTSHELRTPVAKQAMQLELIRKLLGKSDLIDGIKDILDVMGKTVKRQETILRNILTLSRLEAGGRKYRNGPVYLDRVLRKVIEDYRHTIDTYGIRLGMDLEEILISSDEEMLWHVFSNLINNAIKFSKTKEVPRIDILLLKKEQDVLVKISDNGIGLTTEEKEKVFERFFQRETSDEGIGVGLTITRVITENLGGKIWFESDGKEKGTTAVVALPLTRPDQA